MKEGWTYKRLGEVATIVGGSTPKTSVEKYWGGAHYWVTPANLDGNKYQGATPRTITDSAVKETNLQLLPIGTVLLSSRAPIGKIAITTVPMYCNQGFKNIVCSDFLINEFVYWYLYGKVEYLNSLGRGATFKEISKKATEQIPIPVPSLEEQQHIVDYLNVAFAQIDELKSNAERQLAEARALFQSALTQAMQPKPGWQEIAFKDICSFVRGPFGGSLKKECFKESGYAVYEQQNAIYNKFSFRYFIDEEKYESMKRFSVNPGDLIMSCSGTIGKVAIIPDDAKQGIINQALLKLTPSKKINKYYLKYLMESELFKELIRSYSDGAAIQNIASVSILKEILLRIPSVSEQKRIAEYNDSLTASFYEIEDNYKQTAAECDALKQALLRQIFE